MNGTGHQWPSAGDYVAAVQDPENCLLDERLRDAQFKLNRLGLPVVRSGQTAVVFPATIWDLQAAVRFFTAPTEAAERYRMLTEYLRLHPSELFLQAEWIPEAVAFGQGTYPAVLMPWVGGMTISSFIEEAVADGEHDSLRQLAEQWRHDALALMDSGIVHGDLQHGNVMVTSDGSLRLIDYDSTWVPGSPRLLNELGHPNYQHPQRLELSEVTPAAEVFSSFVIYLSLLAVSDDSSLWTKFHNEENLLFTQDDFREAGRNTTQIWDALATSSDPRVVSHADTLMAMCRVPLSDLPSLETLLTEGSAAIETHNAFVPDRAGRGVGREWWSGDGGDHEGAPSPWGEMGNAPWERSDHSSASGRRRSGGSTDVRTPSPSTSASVGEASRPASATRRDRLTRNLAVMLIAAALSVTIIAVLVMMTR